MGLGPGLLLNGALTDSLRWVIGLAGAMGGGASGGGGRNGGGGDLSDLMLIPFELGVPPDAIPSQLEHIKGREMLFRTMFSSISV